MIDPNRPVLSKEQLAALIGERIVNTDHPLATCLVVMADGTDARCNVADFDPAVHRLSPNSLVIPPNYVAPNGGQGTDATKGANTGTAKPVIAGAPLPPEAPAGVVPLAPTTTVVTPPPVAPAPAFTMKTADGKFFRSDDQGRRLNPTDFVSQTEAAAAAITLDAATGAPL